MKRDTLILSAVLVLCTLGILAQQNAHESQRRAEIAGNCDLLAALDDFHRWEKGGVHDLALHAITEWRETHTQHALAGRVDAALLLWNDKSPASGISREKAGDMLRSLALVAQR